MNDFDPISAKAVTADEQSASIVVSFGAEWHQLLLDRAFCVVIRRRVPKTLAAKWLYCHVNNPVSAICARAPIEAITELSDAQAVCLSKEIALQPSKISDYVGTGSRVGAYRIGEIQIIRTPVTTEQLRRRLVYHPPQSFFILSKQAKQIVDELAGFSAVNKEKRRTR